MAEDCGLIKHIWIGHDPVEEVSYHVLAHSILTRTKGALIGPVGNSVLSPNIWWRERGPHDTTEFSNARFIVPYLMDYRGWALFIDSDMLCLQDIHALFEQADDRYAVMVVKHEYEPREETKGLGWQQTRYGRKNWSSLMLMNCGHEAYQRRDWLEYVNEAPGLDLHQFKWCADEEIGEIRGAWNTLLTKTVFEDPQAYSFLPHFTLGGPWFGYCQYPYAQEWAAELERMLIGKNPCARVSATLTRTGLTIGGAYVPEARNQTEAEEEA